MKIRHSHIGRGGAVTSQSPPHQNQRLPCIHWTKNAKCILFSPCMILVDFWMRQLHLCLHLTELFNWSMLLCLHAALPKKKKYIKNKKHKLFYKWQQCQASDTLWLVCRGEAARHKTPKTAAITVVAPYAKLKTDIRWGSVTVTSVKRVTKWKAAR